MGRRKIAKAQEERATPDIEEGAPEDAAVAPETDKEGVLEAQKDEEPVGMEAPDDQEMAAKREAGDEPEIVEDRYTPKLKPDLSSETRRALALRDRISRQRPEFRRQEWFRYKRLGTEWRRPRGMHSKMRRHFVYRPPVVSVGYRSPAAARGLHPSGFKEMLVHSTSDLAALDPKVHAARIAHGVGTKKRKDIIAAADEKGIRVLNRGDL